VPEASEIRAKPLAFPRAARKQPLDRDRAIEVLAELRHHALYRGD
jgi:hypothetical protein